ncbi:hypothetical protein RNI54_004425 [Pseudomonas putida]|nr:hypothetical protein [Pseudomonas putida]
MQAVRVEIPRETVVRRYMSLNIFQKLIESSSLYFSRFTSFDDHLEGGITKKNYSSISNSLEVFDLAMNRQWPAANGSRTDSDDQSKLFNATFPSLFGEQKKLDGDAYLKNVRSWLYASCWTDIPHECLAMWQLYGSSGANCRHENYCIECNESVGRSICIETTIGAILDNLEIDESYNLMARKIDYIDHRSVSFEDEDLAFKPFFSKALHFSYEHEVRFMLWPNRKDIEFSYKYKQSTQNSQLSVSLPIRDINSFIGRIILSPLPPKAQMQIVAKHHEKYSTNLGLSDSLSNTRLRESVDSILLKHGLKADVVDSDLNQTAFSDCYSL